MSLRSRQSGSVFITALLVMVCLSVIVVAYGSRLTEHLRTQGAVQNRRIAEQMARAGIAYARTALEDQDLRITSTNDEWETLGEDGDTTFIVGQGSFRVQIVDAGALIDLNTADQEQLRNLGLTDEQIESLLDWREAGQTPRTQGAKDEYYNGLATPYNTRLANFQTLDELLLVRGFTPETLLEVNETADAPALTQNSTDEQPILAQLLGLGARSANQRTNGQTRLNINTVNLQQMTQAGLRAQAATAIIQRRNTIGTFANLGAVFQTPGLQTQDFAPILDNFSTSTQAVVNGRINLNTAAEPVLRSVPGMTDDTIQAILGRQGTFTGLGELASLSGVNANALRQYADRFTVGSQAFLVRVIGASDSTRVPMQALIVRANDQWVVRQMTPPLSLDPIALWGWSADAASETVLWEAPGNE